ncbi:glutamyl-tRNA reductase [Robertkochia aurantiaca]|uniref:glutamyl-tRNA reductase n=1 Tax=Robertkochia aurantiaca TaxID=2873700 RepID=UPI001CCB27B3|nr:glutamyl-tRNA reductase [Robertkochia sp. 3YJGBD-33]
MKAYNISKHNSFYVVGLSYKKADAEVRGKFSLGDQAQDSLLKQAHSSGIDGLMVISTCNRTELYGFAQHPYQLIQLLCGNTNGTVEEFQSVGYVYKNNHAISHIFKVGTGLDSQILGDFEIISQLKQGFLKSRSNEIANPFLERLINSVIQASKRIKNETEISSGATSVAFASVQYILARVPDISNKNIVLFGTGKIGRNTCENLVKHTDNDHIVLINRTKDRAEKVAGKFNLLVKTYEQLQEEIAKADVLIVATGSQRPTVNKDLIHTDKDLLILDLSIPKNVDDNVEDLANVTLVHLDRLSQITDETLKRREKFIPKAEKIIEEVENDFRQWLETRKFAPTIKALKKKLKNMKDAEIDFQRKKIDGFNEEQAEVLSNRIIQKITTHFANHLRESPNSSDESLELIKKVFQLENNK